MFLDRRRRKVAHQQTGKAPGESSSGRGPDRDLKKKIVSRELSHRSHLDIQYLARIGVENRRWITEVTPTATIN